MPPQSCDRCQLQIKKENQIGIMDLESGRKDLKIIKKIPSFNYRDILQKYKDNKIKIITNNFNDLMKLNIIIASPAFTPLVS